MNISQKKTVSLFQHFRSNVDVHHEKTAGYPHARTHTHTHTHTEKENKPITSCVDLLPSIATSVLVFTTFPGLLACDRYSLPALLTTVRGALCSPRQMELHYQAPQGVGQTECFGKGEFDGLTRSARRLLMPPRRCCSIRPHSTSTTVLLEREATVPLFRIVQEGDRDFGSFEAFVAAGTVVYRTSAPVGRGWCTTLPPRSWSWTTQATLGHLSLVAWCRCSPWTCGSTRTTRTSRTAVRTS